MEIELTAHEQASLNEEGKEIDRIYNQIESAKKALEALTTGLTFKVRFLLQSRGLNPDDWEMRWNLDDHNVQIVRKIWTPPKTSKR